MRRSAVGGAGGAGAAGKGVTGKNAGSKSAGTGRPGGWDFEPGAAQWPPAPWPAQAPGGRHGARRRQVWLMRLRRYAQLCLANLAGRSGPVSPELVEVMRSIMDPPDLPPGHPERAVPWAPPTPVEQELWADLLGYGRR
ncbi:MAG TPA: hypothetical protein VFU73_15205 [Actinocrinis sp.]|nr:hypothetical protein [Actinocrinis sp.]